MSGSVWIGNLISLAASGFMIASCLTHKREAVFRLQFFQCLLLGVSSWFLNSYSGIAANLISGPRNLAVTRGRFDAKTMTGFLIASVVLGVLVNNRGWIGYLPVVANLQFAFCAYALTSLKGTKLSIALNVLIWIVYSFLVCDLATGISDSVVLLVTSGSLLSLIRQERADRKTAVHRDDLQKRSVVS